jgi:hypothetical protein
MPGIGFTDSADLVAQARAETGLSCQLQQTRRELPHPRDGGSSGYPVWFRDAQLAKWHAGEATEVSAASLYRWEERCSPYRQTGAPARMAIVGVDMIHLATFLIAHSDSPMDEMAAFIYNEGGALYSNQRISERLKDLAITKKKASIEAFQALNEDVQLRVYTFWNYPPPLGIFQVSLFRLIDFDEFGVTLERCNRSCGWALKVFRVRKDGHYKVGRKITILFAIEPGDPALLPHVRGSVANPRRWICCIRSKGTSTNVFRDFCETVCADIEANGIAETNNHRVFLWDNFSAHHSAYVHETVTNRAGPRRFSIVPRPQYHPKFGPIEYKICEVTSRIKLKKEADWDMDDLEQQIMNIAMDIGPFETTFLHCGYQR